MKHLNYAFCFNDINSNEYLKLEQRLLNLNALSVLCTINPENTAQRLIHRTHYTNEVVTEKGILEYIKNQQHFIDIANKSTVPTLIINTDDLDWDKYAKMILDKIK